MSVTLTNIAQQVQDLYLQTYAEDSEFFTLDDFIDYTGNAISDFYQTVWATNYKELFAEKLDEVVTFDSGILSQQELSVSDEQINKSTFLLPLKYPIMSFLYDRNNCGLQAVFYTKDKDCGEYDTKAIRTTIIQKNSIARLPICDRIFYYLDGDNLGIINRRALPIKAVNVYYVPQVNKDMIVPNGIIQRVIGATITLMKEAKKDVVMKRELGNNNNVVLQGELDKSQLK